MTELRHYYDISFLFLTQTGLAQNPLLGIDSLGRTTKVTDHHDQVVEYTYGKLGQRESITYPDGKKVSYSFDDVLRLAQVNDGSQVIDYEYDSFSRLTSKEFTSGARTEYSYNELGQLGKLSHFGGAGLLDRYVYSYDALGNKTSTHKTRQGMETDSGLFSYAYDPLNRLSEVVKDGDLLRSYGYDSFGNRTKMVENGNETSYHFNALNQLISSTDGMKYHYDGRGNLIEAFKDDNLVNKHYFGALNRLESTLNHETGQSSIYKYSGLGNRTGQVIGDLDLNPMKKIDAVLDLTRGYNNLLQRTEDGTNATSFTYDFWVLSASNDQGNHNYLMDELGSPIRLVDGTGSELDVFGYDEFGAQFGTTFSTKQPFGFTGYANCEISGLALSPSRAYSPELGRFTSQDTHWNPNNMMYGDRNTFSDLPTPLRGIAPDPLALGQSSNLYSYTMSNPVNNVDLNGEFLITLTKATLIIVGAVTVVGGGVTAYDRGSTAWEETECWRTTTSSSVGGFVEGGTQAGLGALTQAVLPRWTPLSTRVGLGAGLQGLYNPLGVTFGYGTERGFDWLLGVERDMEARNEEFKMDIATSMVSGLILGGLSPIVPIPNPAEQLILALVLEGLLEIGAHNAGKKIEDGVEWLINWLEEVLCNTKFEEITTCP